MVLLAGGIASFKIRLWELTEDSWFISGCLVREKPVPGQKHQGEELVETLLPTPTGALFVFPLFIVGVHQAILRRKVGMPNLARYVSLGA